MTIELIQNYIDGKLTPPKQNEYLPNYSPATGEMYSKVPHSDRTDIELAVQAAESAFAKWSRTPSEFRGSILRKISDAILSHQGKLAHAESIDSGKPVSLAFHMDIKRSAQNFSFFADAATQFSSECHPVGDTLLNYTLRSPLGTVACISPWNLPLYLLTWKIAPALAVGNCVVAKPSELTPMTAFLLSQICIEAGLPPGVLNIVHGTGAVTGRALIEHPKIKAISFTGSTLTGKAIAQSAAPQFKKLSLEMGGKNPAIVFEDADFEAAVAGVARGAFLNQGQICLCGSRIYIQRSIYSRFREALLAQVRKLKIGDPLEAETEQGAVVSEAHLQKILSYIALAKEEGGKVLIGGIRPDVGARCAQGWFVAPTLIENLNIQCKTNQDEIFGPVATLEPFDTEEEVVSWANQTQYGLAASVWTQNSSRAHRIAQLLETGIVWVNCWMVRDLRTPFGGVKTSGVGREGGNSILQFFTEPKNVCIQYGPT